MGGRGKDPPTTNVCVVTRNFFPSERNSAEISFRRREIPPKFLSVGENFRAQGRNHLVAR